MRRIWVLSELYFPEQTSTGYLLTQIAEGLATDYEVKVITGPGTKFLKREHTPKYEIHNQVEIFRCSGTSFDKNHFPGRLANLITRSSTILWKALRLCKRGEPLLVVTNPPLLPFVALLIKWLRSCPIVLLIHDVYPEALVASGVLRHSSFIVNMINVMNRVLYKQAATIISLGRDMTELVSSKLDTHNKIVYIPNWAENEIIFPQAKRNNALLNELGVTDKFVVLYAGNMGRTHGIEYLAETVQRLQEMPHIHFIFLGFGAKQQWLADYIAQHHLQNVHLLAPRARADQALFLNACDVAIISFVANMAGVSVPSRMYNQMAAGKPIIAMADAASELSHVVREEQLGWITSPGDVTGLVQTIEFAAAHPELCAAMGNRAAVVAQTKYTFTHALTSYKHLFTKLLTNPFSPIKQQGS